MTDPSQQQPRPRPYPWFFGDLRTRWPILDFYERFEQIVAMVLSFFLILVILAALWSLATEVYDLMAHSAVSGFTHDAITIIFGNVLSLLIAMEFNHTIFHSVSHRGQIVRVKTVVLIAILAIARQFIILETEPASSSFRILAFAVSVLFLGIVYYLMDKRDRARQE
ncbi:MAG: phosphate-starvation-inducible PsiE family protein [Acidithiobacillus sp.]